MPSTKNKHRGASREQDSKKKKKKKVHHAEDAHALHQKTVAGLERALGRETAAMNGTLSAILGDGRNSSGFGGRCGLPLPALLSPTHHTHI